MLSGSETAFVDLYKALPIAIQDFLESQKKIKTKTNDSALLEIESASNQSGRSIYDQITFENFGYYLGFDKL